VAKSISQAQAEALASGFFDELGSTLEGKEALVPKRSLSVLYQLAGELVDEAQKNLIKSNKIATGKGSESLRVENPKRVGKMIHITVSMLYYLRFVNKGVNGTKKSQGSESKFRYPNPSKKHVAAIESWMKRGGISSRARDVSKYGTHGKNEKKNKEISTLGAAYAVARSIKIKGLKKTGFLDKAIESTERRAKQQLGAALKVDVINSLPKSI
jgi:hypothetical protein